MAVLDVRDSRCVVRSMLWRLPNTVSGSLRPRRQAATAVTHSNTTALTARPPYRNSGLRGKRPTAVVHEPSGMALHRSSDEWTALST